MHFGLGEAVCFDCGHPVRMVVLEAQGGAVLGVVLSLPSGSVSGPLRTLNEHFQL